MGVRAGRGLAGDGAPGATVVLVLRRPVNGAAAGRAPEDRRRPRRRDAERRRAHRLRDHTGSL